MTKADLISEIAIATGFDKTTVSVIVEAYMNSVKGHLTSGENIYLRGFGTFLVKKRKAKIARNIGQSTSVHVPEHNIAAFKPAKEFALEMRKK